MMTLFLLFYVVPMLICFFVMPRLVKTKQFDKTLLFDANTDVVEIFTRVGLFPTLNILVPVVFIGFLQLVLIYETLVSVVKWANLKIWGI